MSHILPLKTITGQAHSMTSEKSATAAQYGLNEYLAASLKSFTVN